MPEDDPSPSLVRNTLTLPAVFEPKANVQRIALRVLAGPDEPKVFSNSEERCLVGTHPSVELRLDDPTVSRFHCEIVVAPDRVTLSDLGSRNGTFVNGVRVERCMLHDGAVIEVGGTQLRVEMGGGVTEVPLSARGTFGTMVGVSEPMRRVFAVLERAAESDVTVLLTGETGTGKEAAAESIHVESPRAEGPFVVVDCSAIPPNLLESELFGHEKGAFTGASGDRQGAFQAADGGTVFLDELGELPIELQPKLLRVLEKRQIKPIGASSYRNVDVRVVAATNRNLKAEVNQRAFRSDLYYRLAVLEVRLPPLRDRLIDLPVLIEHLLDGRTDVTRDTAKFLRSPSFHLSLQRHPWPGNVRELRNHLERCIALREAVTLESADAPPRDEERLDIDPTRPYSEARTEWLRRFERRYLEALLALHDNNVSAVARAARLDRAQLYRLLWRTGLRERD